MSEDPQIREWFESSSKLEPSSVFVDSVLQRIQVAQRRMRAATAISILLVLGLLWIDRSQLTWLAGFIATVFDIISLMMISPLTWIVSATLLIAAWSVARCRGSDV